MRTDEKLRTFRALRSLVGRELDYRADHWRGSGHVICPAEVVSSVFPRNAHVDIKDPLGNVVGALLCLRNRLVGNVVDLADLTDVEYIAYVADFDEPSADLPHRFASDYVAIEELRFEEYAREYARSAPLWGGFAHLRFMSVGLPASMSLPITEVTMRENVKYPTKYHEICSIRSTVQPYGIERFLKLYHMVELLFDWDIVQRVVILGDDLEGIGQILSQHKSKELDYLTGIIENRCSDFVAISERLADVQPHETTAKLIFYEFGKDGNPLEQANFETFFCNARFTQAVYNTNRTLHKKSFQNFVSRLSAYWIYRLRSSIAHHRIGEYLLTDKDEGFVIEFGEPLLREILCQAFGKQISEAENLKRWKASGQPAFWVDSRNGQWNHDDWLALIEALKRSQFWPLRPNDVGLLLEELKRNRRT